MRSFKISTIFLKFEPRQTRLHKNKIKRCKNIKISLLCLARRLLWPRGLAAKSRLSYAGQPSGLAEKPVPLASYRQRARLNG